MTILQNMYQATVKELNAYKIMCDEQRRELKELKDMVKWHEEKHISKLDHKDRNSFVYRKGIKCDTEYEELGTQFLLQKEVKNEDKEYAEIRTQDVFEDLTENLREEKSVDVEFLEFGTYDVFEEQKKG